MVFNTVPVVKINLSNGLYIFDPLSATGKTYLSSVLTKLANLREPVMAYTYDDFVKGVDPEMLVRGRPCKVIFFDRFDMYLGAENIVKFIRKFAENTIVLVDVKANKLPNIGNYRSVEITFTPEVIEVGL